MANSTMTEEEKHIASLAQTFLAAEAAAEGAELALLRAQAEKAICDGRLGVAEMDLLPFLGRRRRAVFSVGGEDFFRFGNRVKHEPSLPEEMKPCREEPKPQLEEPK